MHQNPGRGSEEIPMTDSLFLSNFIRETLVSRIQLALKGLSFTQFNRFVVSQDKAVFTLIVRLLKKEGSGDTSPQIL
jgi:hypothetical protein